MAQLSIAGVGHAYGDHKVLSDIDLSVDAGAFVSLLGPSGCGKTTMLRIIAGFVEPTEGRVALAGRTLNGVPPHKRNIGVVFQSYALFPHMSAAGNVGFGLKMRDVPRADRDTRTAKALSLVGLGHLAERYPSQLSGGQQQRVALARALVIEPDVLLLDEPLSNLDAGLRAEMRDEIAKLTGTLGITTVFVTHDQSEALALSDQVVVMDAGRIVEQGPPERLAERPERAFTARFLGGRTVLSGTPAANRAAFVVDGGEIPLEVPAPPGTTHLALRASRLRIDAPGADGVPCTVTRSVYLGDYAQVSVTLSGAAVTVHAPTDGPLPPDGPASLVAMPGALSFLTEPAPANPAK